MLQWRLYESNGNDALTLIKNAEQPTIKTATDVLVKIHALSLNARDNQFTSGTYALKVPQDGAVVTSGEQPLARVSRCTLMPCCTDAAGEVVQVGQAVTVFKVGDRVSPIPMPGYHHVRPRAAFPPVPFVGDKTDISRSLQSTYPDSASLAKAIGFGPQGTATGKLRMISLQSRSHH